MAETNPFTEPLASSAAPSAAAAAAGADTGAQTGPPTGQPALAADVNAAVAKRNAVASAGYGSVSAAGGAVGGAAGDDGPYTRPDPEVDGPGAAFGGKPTGGSDADVKAGDAPAAAAASASDERAVNALYLILTFLSWVGCWVVFTGRMNYLYTGDNNIPSATCQMYWNRMECKTSVDTQPSINFGYGECINLLTWHMTEICSACHRSGQGTLALAVFAFFSLTALLVLLVARVIGRSASIPWAGADTGRYLKVETALTAFALFCFWVIVMLWRTKCMEEAQNWDHYWEAVVVGSGWWYCVGVFFFLTVNLIISLSYSANPWCRGRCHDTLAEQASVTQAARAPNDPTCLTGFQNSPAFATRCDAVLNVAVAVCCVLCWIGALVAIGGELHRVTLNVHPGGTLTFNWKTYGKSGEMTTYDDCAFTTDSGTTIQVLSQDQCDSCSTGGKGTVAVGALAFIVESLIISFILLRMSGKVKAKLMRAEWWLSVLATILFVFIATVWGGTCFNSVRQGLPAAIPNTIMGTGWGYDIFCFLLTLVVVLLLWIVRHRAGDLPSLEQGGVYATLRSEV